MHTITYRLTQSDIEQGEWANPFACPIAHATRRALGLEPCGVSVITRIHLDGHPNALAAEMGPNLLRWRRRFDNEKPVSPITIRLEYGSEAYGRAEIVDEADTLDDAPEDHAGLDADPGL